MLNKIKTIVLSRITKPKTDKWIKDRRNKCNVCPFNTKNMEKVPLKIKIIKALSDFYTWITFNKKTELGNCSLCGCDIYYKTETKIEKCEDNQWNLD